MIFLHTAAFSYYFFFLIWCNFAFWPHSHSHAQPDLPAAAATSRRHGVFLILDFALVNRKTKRKKKKHTHFQSCCCDINTLMPRRKLDPAICRCTPPLFASHFGLQQESVFFPHSSFLFFHFVDTFTSHARTHTHRRARARTPQWDVFDIRIDRRTLFVCTEDSCLIAL